MPAGRVHALYLFEVGDAIDVRAIPGLVDATVAAVLTTKPASPPYLQYQQPPVFIDGTAIGATAGGHRVRFTVYDYGIVSVGITEPLPDSWDDVVELGQRWQDNPRILSEAERCCRELLRRIAGTVTVPRASFLWDDYVIFIITPPSSADTAEALLSSRGPALAQLLRGEREPLSPQERDEVLRHRISYYATDLVIATWSSALVYDTEAGAQSAVEILEYANSQLLQFRYYDQLLDGELARIYAQLQKGGWRQNWSGRRYTRAARHVHSLFIDVNELTDRAENALKIAGDVYVARLFAMTAARLGLEQWRGNVREKLKTLDDIYRFAVEHAAMTRGELLELIVVILILLELILLVVTGLH
jgi:hypothetical protein